MIAEALGRLVPLLRPDAVGAELLLAAALVALVVAAATVLGALPAPACAAPATGAAAFSRVRVRLRASDPDAAGHHRARAPGSAR